MWYNTMVEGISFDVEKRGTRKVDKFELLIKYKKLLEDNIITQEEFDKKRRNC